MIAEVKNVMHPCRALLVSLVVASSCGNGDELSSESDPTSPENRALSTSEVAPGNSERTPQDLAGLPESDAPHGLGEIDVPDTADGIVALFDRLPANLSGRQRTDERPPALSSRISASYGSTDPVGCGMVGLQAMNVSTGDLFPKGWTAEMVMAMFTTGADWSVEDFGRDGELLWVMFTTICSTEDALAEDVVSTLNWGVTGSPWVFSASADATELRDELTRAFVTAAG